MALSLEELARQYAASKKPTTTTVPSLDNLARQYAAEKKQHVPYIDRPGILPSIVRTVTAPTQLLDRIPGLRPSETDQQIPVNIRPGSLEEAAVMRAGYTRNEVGELIDRQGKPISVTRGQALQFALGGATLPSFPAGGLPRAARAVTAPRVTATAATAAALPQPKMILPMSGAATPIRAGVMQTAPPIIDRVTGTNLGSQMFQVRAIEDPLMSSRNMALRRAGVLKLSQAEDKNLFRVLEGRAAPSTPRVQQVATAFAQMAREDAADYVQRGAMVMDAPMFNPQTGFLEPQWRPFQAVQNYAPRNMDPLAISKAEIRTLVNHIIRDNKSLPTQIAVDVAVGLKARALGEGVPQGLSAGARQLLRAGKHTPSHLHARTGFTLPDEYVLSMKESLPAYVRDSAKERALLQVYGPADGTIRSALNSAAATGHPDAKLAVEAWNRYRGLDVDSPVAEKFGQVTRILGNVATTSFLGVGTAIKQLSQLVFTAADLPLRSVGHGFIKAFTKQGIFDAQASGAVLDDLLRDAVQSRGMLSTATGLDRLERATGRAATFVVQKTGIARMDAMARTVTYHAALHDFQRLRQAAVAGSGQAAAKLGRVGLSATSPFEDLTRAAKQVSDTLNIKTGMIDMLYALTTPSLSFIRQLNSFNIGMTGLMKNRFILPLVNAARRKDARGVAEGLGKITKLVAGGTVAGEGIATALRAMQGRSDDRPGGSLGEFIGDLQRGVVPTRVVIARAADDLAFAAVFGYLQSVKEAMISSGPQERAARLLGTGVGAGISNVVELASQGANVVMSDDQGRAPSDSARANADRALLRRLPGVGGIVAPRVLPSEFSDRRRAVNAMVRAINRKDLDEAAKWQAWFFERHGKAIGGETIAKAVRSYNR